MLAPRLVGWPSADCAPGSSPATAVSAASDTPSAASVHTSVDRDVGTETLWSAADPDPHEPMALTLEWDEGRAVAEGMVVGKALMASQLLVLSALRALGHKLGEVREGGARG